MMRTIIYILLVGYMSISGFFSLKNNDWEVRELPEFMSTFQVGERVLPAEQWEAILPGRWKYKVVFEEFNYKGTATFNADGTFSKKLGFTFYRKNNDLKAGGTVKGTWEVQGNKTWTEYSESCNFSNDYACAYFPDTLTYGAVASDLRDYKVVYFNQDRIEIRSESLVGKAPRVWKFTRDD